MSFVGDIIDSITGADDAADAARSAGDIQAQATREATEEQRRQFDVTREDLQPYRQAGRSALPGLTDLVTNPQAQRSFIEDNPFFQSLAEDAQNRIFSNQAARGKVGSGETAEALQNSLLLLGSDLLNQNIAQRQNLVGMGLGAATRTGQFGAQATSNITDLITSGAAARAAGEIGAANAITQGRQGIIGAGANIGSAALMGPLSLSDKRYKKDIKKVGEDDKGLNVYTYKYKGDDTTRIGHMAQDVKKKYPEAVKTIADMHMIDYDKLEA